MHWIYLSPHFDDAALSCGGLIWQQTQAGNIVSVWTVCAGEPPPGPFSNFAQELHQRWGSGRAAVALRREEDIAACIQMQAEYRHLLLPDGIYRRVGEQYLPSPAPTDASFSSPHVYQTWEEMIDLERPPEAEQISQLAEFLSTELPPNAQIVSPLALGSHVDHRLVRAAAEQTGRPLLYYADYPYIVRGAEAAKLALMQQAGWKRIPTSISPAAFAAWLRAISTYQSQLSTFWQDSETMEREMHTYLSLLDGAMLWKQPEKR